MKKFFEKIYMCLAVLFFVPAVILGLLKISAEADKLEKELIKESEANNNKHL